MVEQTVSIPFFRQEVLLMGFLSRGEARTLNATIQDDGVPRTIFGATAWETDIMGRDGTRVVLNNAAHTIVETSGPSANVGQVNIALTSAQSIQVAQGKDIRFKTTFTLAGQTYIYWGTIPEVRGII